MDALDYDWDDPALLEAINEAEATAAYQRLRKEGAQDSQPGAGGPRLRQNSHSAAQAAENALRGEGAGRPASRWNEQSISGPGGGCSGERGGVKRARDDAAEGEYLAALRGSNSQAWLDANKRAAVRGRGPGVGHNGSSLAWNAGFSNHSMRSSSDQGLTFSSNGESRPAGGACFKCGGEGHWAKDCPTEGTRRHSTGALSSSVGDKDGRFGMSAVPSDRQCPCGAGLCVVLTANTERNKGRSFYRCPKRKDEGQCDFFEWCEGAPSGVAGDGAAAPELPCPCGAGRCAVRTAKTERNRGRSFYVCPLPQESSCHFFQWCDGGEQSPFKEPSSGFTPNGQQSLSRSNLAADGGMGRGGEAGGYNSMAMSMSMSGRAPLGSCYSCGQEGHWARDCPNKDSQAAAAAAAGGGGGGGRYPSPGVGSQGGASGGSRSGTGTGSCFLCNGDGHWAKDCPEKESRGGGRAGRGSFEGLSGRGDGERRGEWGGGGGAGAGARVSGSCHRCGEPGHWASSCPGGQNRRESSAGRWGS